MIISAVVIIVYTCSGGFLAASFTDLIQSIVMTCALMSIIIFGLSKVGGVGEVISNAEGIDGYLSLFSIHNTETGVLLYWRLSSGSVPTEQVQLQV